MTYLSYKLVSIIPLYLLAFAVLLGSPTPARAAYILSADFENQDFHSLAQSALCCSHSAQITNLVKRYGNYAVKFTLNSDDAGIIGGTFQNPARRAEIRKDGTARVGDTRWYGLSIMIDPSWRDDTKDPNGTVVASWHRNPDPGEIDKTGQLGLEIKNDQWEVRNISDPNPITTSTSFTKRQWFVGAVEKGKWVDWVVFAKWSYNSDGILRVWKNGALVVDYHGPNVYNDQRSEFFKFGIYKAWWKQELPATRNTLVAYHDEVRIGDQNSSYEQVAPRGSPPQTSTIGSPLNLTVTTD